MLKTLSAALIVAGFAITPALTQTSDTVYTRFDTKNKKTCPHTPSSEPEDYGTWRCKGYGDMDVRIHAGDQRMYITFGSDKDTLAEKQTFDGFNNAYSGTIEWRREKQADGKGRPFATILRWNVSTGSDGPSRGQVLVVTRLGPGGVCHVGYVDAVANSDANALARKLADEHARTFKCGTDKRIVVGKVGKVGMPTD